MLYRLRRIWPLGIRAQLTLLYMTVFAVVVIAAGAAYSIQMKAVLEAGFDTSLRIHTDQIANGIALQDDGTISITDTTGELPNLPTQDPVTADTATAVASPGPSVTATVPATPTVPPTPVATTAAMMTPVIDTPTPVTNAGGSPTSEVQYGTLVRVLDGHGIPVYTSPAFTILRVPNQSVRVPMTGNPWRGTVSTRTDQEVRLYSMPLKQDDGTVWGILQVGETLNSITATQRQVEQELFVMLPFVLILDAAVSFWLAGRAFVPIRSVIKTARTIGASDLQQRVPVPPARDDIQELTLAFNEMIGRLDTDFKRQQRFTADASHELRTPVAAIRTMAEVTLEKDTQSAEYQRVLRSIIQETDRLGHLVSQLLMLARADEGEIKVQREHIELDRLIQDVVLSLEVLAEEKGIAIRSHFEPTTICGDEARLIQVIINLLTNALTYTDRGGIISVVLKHTDQAAIIVVSDTGIGISKEALPHIFERFYRADAARSRTTGGTGLGLALVDWVIREHHGTIDVASTPDIGTQFTITLPLALETDCTD